MLTDPIADMLTRIRNANKALHEKAEMPTSRMKEEIARLLKEEGYIRDYRVEKGETFDTLVVELKFGRNRERVITGLKRVSKPGRRVYARKDRLPRVLGGMGIADPVHVHRSGHEPHRAGARHRRRGRLLHLVDAHESNRKSTHRTPRRRDRRDRPRPRRGRRARSASSQQVVPQRMQIEQERRRARRSRGRPSAARTARCTG